MRGSTQGLVAHSRSTCAVRIQAKLKIAQNHNRSKRAPIDIDTSQLYCNSGFLPAANYGPIKVANVPGKGRALVATSPINPGDLLLVSEPLGMVVRGPEGASLQPEHLVPALTADGALSARDRQRAALLYNGTASSSSRQVTLEDLAPTPPADKATAGKDAQQGEGSELRTGDVRKKLKAAQASSKNTSKGFGSKPSSAPTAGNPSSGPSSSASNGMSAEVLAEVVRYNCWGIEYADLGAAATRGEPSRSYVGVWPEFSLMNHSCVPNTSVMLIGDRLLVRAAASIPTDGEVTTTYLGAQGGAPLSERQRALQATYSFKCTCPRCKVEESAGEEIAGLLEDMWGWFEQGKLLERVRAQVAARDPALAALRTQLTGHLNRLEQLLSSNSKVAPQLRDWVRASAYGCYELLAVCKDVSVAPVEAPGAVPGVSSSHGDPSTTPPAAAAQPTEGPAAAAAAGPVAGGEQDGTDGSLPASLVPLIEVIAPASDTHLYITLEWLTRVGRKHGTSHPGAQQAAHACLTAHLLRYGRVPDALLTKLMTERAKVDHYLGRINLPSPWAATNSVPAATAAEQPPAPTPSTGPVAV